MLAVPLSVVNSLRPKPSRETLIRLFWISDATNVTLAGAASGEVNDCQEPANPGIDSAATK